MNNIFKGGMEDSLYRPLFYLEVVNEKFRNRY